DNGGTLPVGDKSDPELIMEKTGLSKAAFKRAVGRLYREHLVVPGRDSVVLQDGGKM
nr:RNA-binding protein [Lachnospiraceae bacterium]